MAWGCSKFNSKNDETCEKLSDVKNQNRFNKEITDKKFVSVIVKEKKNLWDALKLMLSKELKEDE